MFDTKKFENIEDPEVKKLVEQMKDFMFPKAEEFQKKLQEKNMGMLKMLKMAKDFLDETNKEYNEKFGTEMKDDVMKINDYLGVNQAEVLDMLKMMKTK
jgi:hypothetical protein